MSHEIPEPYVWDASFLVFYETLDTDHKGLFEAVWRVAKNPSSQHYLKELKRLVSRHFKIEEEALKNAGYSELFAHKALHDDFIDKLAAISTPVTADHIQFAKVWLVNHIKNTDFKYKGQL